MNYAKKCHSLNAQSMVISKSFATVHRSSTLPTPPTNFHKIPQRFVHARISPILEVSRGRGLCNLPYLSHNTNPLRSTSQSSRDSRHEKEPASPARSPCCQAPDFHGRASDFGPSADSTGDPRAARISSGISPRVRISRNFRAKYSKVDRREVDRGNFKAHEYIGHQGEPRLVRADFHWGPIILVCEPSRVRGSGVYYGAIRET